MQRSVEAAERLAEAVGARLRLGPQVLYTGRDLAEDVLRRVGILWNMYGPTETTIYTTAHECAPGVAEAPPIGRPVQGAGVYVLDARGEPAPVGDWKAIQYMTLAPLAAKGKILVTNWHGLAPEAEVSARPISARCPSWQKGSDTPGA